MGFLLLAAVQLIPDDCDPAGVVAAPAASLAISHMTADFAPGPVAAAAGAYNDRAPVAVTVRSHAQVTALFGSNYRVAPGVVPISRWRPTAALL